jgi:plastocyanin
MGNVLLSAAAVSLAAVATAAAPVYAQPAASHPKPVTVQADNFRFCAGSAGFCTPQDSGHVTTVKLGTRVTWVYRDTACDAVVPCPGHDVIFRHFGTSTFVKTDGARIYSMVFRSPGTFSYYCGAHQSFGMTGTVVVKR